jgi:hypothetical protein
MHVQLAKVVFIKHDISIAVNIYTKRIHGTRATDRYTWHGLYRVRQACNEKRRKYTLA